MELQRNREVIEKQTVDEIEVVKKAHAEELEMVKEELNRALNETKEKLKAEKKRKRRYKEERDYWKTKSERFDEEHDKKRMKSDELRSRLEKHVKLDKKAVQWNKKMTETVEQQKHVLDNNVKNNRSYLDSPDDNTVDGEQRGSKRHMGVQEDEQSEENNGREISSLPEEKKLKIGTFRFKMPKNFKREK